MNSLTEVMLREKIALTQLQSQIIQEEHAEKMAFERESNSLKLKLLEAELKIKEKVLKNDE